MFATCVYFTLSAAARDLSRIWDRAFSETHLTAALFNSEPPLKVPNWRPELSNYQVL